MPEDKSTGIPLEILAKGSASSLIKKSRSISVRQKPTAATPPLWSKGKNLDIFTEELNSIINQAEEPADNRASNSSINVPSEQNTENSFTLPPLKVPHKDCSNNCPDNETDHWSTGYLRELRQLHFERIFVRTPRSVYFDGILAWVDEEFIILISQRLCVITIPLSNIVSYYILNP